MSWSFGESFDLYAAPNDALNGYWDSGNMTGVTLQAGRFTGSQALQATINATIMTKTSFVNDAVHHIVCAFRQTAVLSGTSPNIFFELLDGGAAQCSIVFRSDGTILLTSGGANGTTLATYAGAVTANNTWYAFEFEVSINNTTGVFNVRKNGNPVNDFSASSLNTRNSANNYANKLTVGLQTSISAQQIDDLFWQSGAATGTWLGDIRCYARMPASDQSVTFSRLSPIVQTPVAAPNTTGIAAGTARYTPFTAACDGAIGTATVSLGTGYTGNLKCSIFASSGGVPTTVLGSATVVSNPIAGSNTITFGTPVSVTKGTQYIIGFDSDTSSGTWNITVASATGFSSTTTYASFPTASPTTAVTNAVGCSLTITVSTNNSLVNEPQEDGLTSYVYDSNPGDADFYGVASIASTPAVVFATVTRAYMQKSDAGTRTAAVQLKSGAATVASPTLVLTTSGWQWAWRMDLTDPNTGAAWTPAAVNNAQIGPKVIA